VQNKVLLDEHALCGKKNYKNASQCNGVCQLPPPNNVLIAGHTTKQMIHDSECGTYIDVPRSKCQQQHQWRTAAWYRGTPRPKFTIIGWISVKMPVC